MIDEGTSWTDFDGDLWVPTACYPERGLYHWRRWRDGAEIEVTPSKVEIVWDVRDEDRTAYTFTSDPAGWLTDNLGAPADLVPDLLDIRRRERLDHAFEMGWVNAFYELNPDRYDHRFWYPWSGTIDTTERTVPR